MAEGGAGEGGVGLQDGQRLLKIRKGVAQISHNTTERVQTILDTACARHAVFFQLSQDLINSVQHIVCTANEIAQLL